MHSKLLFAAILLVSMILPFTQADCGTAYPWVEPAVRKFAEPMYTSARKSEQSNSAALKAIKGIKWGKFPPGMEQVTLKVVDEDKINMTVDRVSNPNQPYKPVGMLKVLERAVRTHEKELVQLLKDKAEPLVFIVESEDFPIVFKHERWKLPAFAMCTDEAHIDIPVPDFTFEDYPETSYANTSFWAIKELLLHKESMVPWSKRQRNVFMRHFGGVGYRKTLLPVLIGHQQNGTDSENLGLKTDVVDTGFVTSNQKDFVWLDRQCTYRYLLHTAGFSYSAGLKYKLACGSVVLLFESKYQEFYYPALKPGEHYESFPEADADTLHKNVFPQIKARLHKLEAEHHDNRPDMAQAARDFARSQLTQEALSCYWLKALIVYSKIFYLPSRHAVPTSITFDL
ncbi:hypothetical protein CEUSTIGMA_g3890.t1 [Chlamydomonas eustigma]|uniref:Glycosyl transferase CAP10 domain-containing protein n=1 Tax=Chlamydomonas eustigma TaxID=1157962 RepID=A0A250X071_9CHLO|nr:hypothetical protein CEUSTIGMA_g3890.t1 [Chlamydomonas eustigma]|eukprot:GAX76445.1 hypothetical protein CEUSTIGMA_g3890.t1 [Chlamydomonas eustigma]